MKISKFTNVATRMFRSGLMAAALLVSGAALAEGDAAVAAAAAGAAPDALYYAIAATMAIACMSGAFAVGKIGAAVMGAAAEKPEILGKALVIVALGEGIVLFGFLISLFLYTKI